MVGNARRMVAQETVVPDSATNSLDGKTEIADRRFFIFKNVHRLPNKHYNK
ncbi:unnamed protein product [Acanthoscelides obtectus]|uniref:Uncharacterized protein n=1 Tax=Acanthoscelides obtectus TaxID=200917 RepID=A0A9P0PWP4_ACAOB|nr:unnamed protein product [Acanthoscelides obtectus]CAK1670420.1 hypothetical protein AOBTE_LOCUS27624 [Acanthoscelides obtectus]